MAEFFNGDESLGYGFYWGSPIGPISRIGLPNIFDAGGNDFSIAGQFGVLPINDFGAGGSLDDIYFEKLAITDDIFLHVVVGNGLPSAGAKFNISISGSGTGQLTIDFDTGGSPGDQYTITITATNAAIYTPAT
jgi:hypothetical protein